MKKVLSIILSVMLLASLIPSAYAADESARQPDVYVNGQIVEFQDQAPYITDEGRTLVPARGVFEAMNSEVLWDAENYVVTVSNEEQKKEITLKIGDTNMTVKSGEEEETKILDVPAQLMNNRTMIPLRAVSEALESVVVWNPGDYSVYISMSQKISIDQFPSFFPGAGSGANKDDENETEEHVEGVEGGTSTDELELKNIPVVKLVTDAEGLSVGDEFEVYVEISNLDLKQKLSTISVAFEFDKEVLEYVAESSAFVDASGKAVEASMKVENLEFEGGVKASLVTLEAIELNVDSPRVFVCKFKVLKDSEIAISLNDDVYEDGRVATQFSATEDGKTTNAYRSKGLIVDTTKVVIK